MTVVWMTPAPVCTQPLVDQSRPLVTVAVVALLAPVLSLVLVTGVALRPSLVSAPEVLVACGSV